MARMSYIPPTSGRGKRLKSSQIRAGRARQRHAVTARRPSQVRPEPGESRGSLRVPRRADHANPALSTALTDVIETFGRAWDEAVAS